MHSSRHLTYTCPYKKVELVEEEPKEVDCSEKFFRQTVFCKHRKRVHGISKNPGGRRVWKDAEHGGTVVLEKPIQAMQREHRARFPEQHEGADSEAPPAPAELAGSSTALDAGPSQLPQIGTSVPQPVFFFNEEQRTSGQNVWIPRYPAPEPAPTYSSYLPSAMVPALDIPQAFSTLPPPDLNPLAFQPAQYYSQSEQSNNHRWDASGAHRRVTIHPHYHPYQNGSRSHSAIASSSKYVPEAAPAIQSPVYPFGISNASSPGLEFPPNNDIPASQPMQPQQPVHGEMPSGNHPIGLEGFDANDLAEAEVQLRAWWIRMGWGDELPGN